MQRKNRAVQLFVSLLPGMLSVFALPLLTGGGQASAAPARMQGPGVELSPGYTRTVGRGEVVTYTHVVTNSGTSTDTFAVDAAGPTGWWLSLQGGVWPTVTATFPLMIDRWGPG